MQKGRGIFLALVAVGLTVVSLWFTSRSVTPKEATWADVRAEARSGDYGLISTEELRQRLAHAAEETLVVDTRQGWEYRSGHIAGAVSFPMEPTWLSRWRKKGPLETLLGPDRDRFVVFY